jgi:hypothetical protein
MKAHKLNVTVPEDHQLEIRLPEDFPSGPAEIIVLASSSEAPSLDERQRATLRAIQEIRTLQRTPEEEQILDEFDEFRMQQPVNFSSLAEEE